MYVEKLFKFKFENGHETNSHTPELVLLGEEIKKLFPDDEIKQKILTDRLGQSVNNIITIDHEDVTIMWGLLQSTHFTKQENPLIWELYYKLNDCK